MDTDVTPRGEPVPLAIARLASRADEVDELRALLSQEPATPGIDPGERSQVASAVAVASLGDGHLWEDLQLGSRAELSGLMVRWFPVLAARNDRGMRWKRFLYRELCDRSGLQLCRSPSCDACTERALCFAPEVAEVAGRGKASASSA